MEPPKSNMLFAFLMHSPSPSLSASSSFRFSSSLIYSRSKHHPQHPRQLHPIINSSSFVSRFNSPSFHAHPLMLSSLFSSNQKNHISTSTITCQKQQQKQQKQKQQPKQEEEQVSVAITPQVTNYSQWYLDVIAAADLSENSPVKGCMILKPHGYAIWELITKYMDTRIKQRTRAKNVAFPLLIPQSFLTKEAEHVEGFAKECALVTHHRLRVKPLEDNEKTSATPQLEPDPESKLEDPLVIRPTSETIIWNMFAKWIQSHRDLPLKINQWANIIRWELRTRPFLRTTEFYWQEGHTAHATADEAIHLARDVLDMYADFCESVLALPTVRGVKSPRERFAGAEDTYTIEAMMGNGWALQSGTSHFLGQNFARAFDVRYQTQAGERELVWATSWGVSTRLIGALIMTHSNDTGLVLPPAIAPIQVVICVIWKNEADKATVLDFGQTIMARLEAYGFRVEFDARENMRPGAKYYEWERKGVPLRMEIGPRDVASNAVFCAKRDGSKKFSITVDQDFEKNVQQNLDELQAQLLEKAKDRLRQRTLRIDSYDQMKNAMLDDNIETGFYLVPWKCDEDNENKIKDECKATIRCYPFEFQDEYKGRKCFYSGDDATHMAIFARNY